MSRDIVYSGVYLCDLVYALKLVDLGNFAPNCSLILLNSVFIFVGESRLISYSHQCVAIIMPLAERSVETLHWTNRQRNRAQR